MYQSNNQGGHVNAGREAGAFGAAAHTTGTTHTANKTGNQAAAPVATPAAATGRRRFITPALKRKHDKNLITAHRERVIFHLKAGGEFAMLGSDKSLNISILPPPPPPPSTTAKRKRTNTHHRRRPIYGQMGVDRDPVGSKPAMVQRNVSGRIAPQRRGHRDRSRVRGV